jgi:hypothetical protein
VPGALFPEPRGCDDELSPIFGDGLIGQAAAVVG